MINISIVYNKIQGNDLLMFFNVVGRKLLAHYHALIVACLT